MDTQTLISAFSDLTRKAARTLNANNPKTDNQNAATLSTPVNSSESKLADDIKNNYGDEGLMLFNEALYFFGIPDASSTPVQGEEYPNAGDWAPYYNNALYQALLPLCRLALLEEKNGRAEEHAFKLSLLFNDKESALKYLNTFKRLNAYKWLVHDACLFDPPSPGQCNFQQWKIKANASNNMLNPRFRELLPHAAAIEQVARESSKRKTPAERKRELSALSQKRSAARLELAGLGLGTPLGEATITLLQAFYERYRHNQDATHRILVQHGISEANIARFARLPRQTDDQSIPNITLDGRAIGYPGCYLTKLDTQSDQGAALAACLGKTTACCQYIGGGGDACVEHGISSPDGGFYVLFQGDAQNPSLDDTVIGQAWVWRGGHDALCLDSIERNPHVPNTYEQIADMYRYLGRELCSNPEFKIRRVNVGAQSGISIDVAFDDYPTMLMRPKYYKGYRDSMAQLPLSTSDMPYLFYGKVNSPVLSGIIQEETTAYFRAVFGMPGAIRDNIEIQKAIAFLIYTKQHMEKAFLYQVMRDAAGDRIAELDIQFQVNRIYIRALSENRISFTALDNGAYLNAMSSAGRSALHCATHEGDVTLVQQVLDKGINPDIQDKYGNTALINALETVLYGNKNEAGRAIANQLIEAGAGLDIKDKDENTPLIIAVKNQDLEMTQRLVESGADIDTFDGDMKTAIYWAAERGNEVIFEYLLTRNPRLNLISYQHKVSLLMAAVRGGSLAIVDRLISCGDAIDLKSQIKQGGDVQQLVAVKPDMMHLLLQRLPANILWDLLLATDSSGNTIFHWLSSSSGEVGALLMSHFESLPPGQLARFINSKNQYGTPPLILAVLQAKPDLVRWLVEHGADIESCDGNMKTAIYCAVEKGNEVIFEYLLTRNPSLNFIHYQNKESLLMVAAGGRNLAIVDKLLSRGDAIDFQYQSANGNNAAHLAADNLDMMRVFLQHMSPESLMDLLLAANCFGNTILHWLISASDAAREFYQPLLMPYLESLPPEQLAKHVNAKNKHGRTPLICAVKHGDLHLTRWFVEHGADIECRDNDMKNALFCALEDGKTDLLEYLLHARPVNEVWQALMAGDRDGRTVLHAAAKNPQRLLPLLEYCPPDQRADVFASVFTQFKCALPGSKKKQCNEQCLIQMVMLIPSEQRLDFFRKCGARDGRPGLDKHWEPQTTLTILNHIAPESRLDLIAGFEWTSDSHLLIDLLRYTGYSPEFMKSILELIPENQRYMAITRLIETSNLLHWCVSRPTFFRVLLEVIPKNQRDEALEVVDSAGHSTYRMVEQDRLCINPEVRMNYEEMSALIDELAGSKLSRNWQSFKNRMSRFTFFGSSDAPGSSSTVRDDKPGPGGS